MDLSDATLDATGTRAALELRVLSGTQRGARALLVSDGAWTRLGSDAQNDLVLREAPFEMAEIGLQEGQWLWRQPNEDDPVVLRSGQGLRFGPFTLLLCSPSLAWSDSLPEEWAIDRGPDGHPDADEAKIAHGPNQGPEGLAPAIAAPEALASTAADADSTNHTEGDRAPSMGEEPEEQSAEPDTHPAPQPQRAGLSQWLRGRAGRTAIAGGALAASVAVWLLLPLGLNGERVAQTDAQPAADAADASAAASATADIPPAPLVIPAQADLQALQAILVEQPALTQALKASFGPDGRLKLQGVVTNDEALETILRPALQKGLRFSLQVLTSAEWKLRIQALNKSLLPQGVQAQGLPDGRVRLQGVVAQAETMDWMPLTVAQEIPEALGVEMAVLTRSEARQAEEASAATQSARQQSLPPLARLPEVISVIGGADAYIVLADGLRVGPGGQAGTWRVASISAGRVTFVDSLGRSRSLEP